jgi:hypothetical protein
VKAEELAGCSEFECPANERGLLDRQVHSCNALREASIGGPVGMFNASEHSYARIERLINGLGGSGKEVDHAC